jgi:hypothetical protein
VEERLSSFVAWFPGEIRLREMRSRRQKLFAFAPAARRLELGCMTVIKIRGGKPEGAESLCNSCYWAHIQRGFAESEDVVLCAFLRQAHVVTFKVSQCTDYNDKRVPSKADMESIAWIIRTKDINRPMGFSSKEDRDEKVEELEIVPSE